MIDVTNGWEQRMLSGPTRCMARISGLYVQYADGVEVPRLGRDVLVLPFGYCSSR